MSDNHSSREPRSLEPVYQALFESMPMGAVLQQADGAIIAANQAAARILGLSLDQLRRRTSLDLSCQAIHEDGSSFPGEDHPAMRALRSGQIVRDVVMGVFNPETGRHTWINVTAIPQVNAPGESPSLVMVTFEDITARKQTEEKLRASERTLAIFVENAPAAIAMFDREMRYLAASRRYLQDYGLDDRLEGREITGHSHYEIFPELPERWKEIHRRCLAGAIEKMEEDPFQRADGRLDWIRWEIHPWRQTSGEIGGILLFSELTTENKRTQSALRASEERYRLITENTSDVIWVLDLQSSTYSYVSPSVTRLRGYSIEEVLAQGMAESITPASAQHLAEVLPARLAEFTGGSTKTYVDEIEQTRKDGSTVWTETSTRFALNASSGGLEVYGVSRDISERKQAEEQARRLLERLDLATSSAEIGIWDWDIQKNILVWDDQMYRLYGVSREQFSGAYEAWVNGLHPDDRESSHQTSQQAVRGEKDYDTEFRVIWGDGSVHWLRAHGIVTFDEQGQAVRMVGSNYDISAQKNAAQALLDSYQKTSEILESINDGFFELDRNWRFTYINQRAARNVGSSPAEMVGKNIWEAFPGVLGTRIEQIYRRVMEERQPVSFDTAGTLTQQWYTIQVYPSALGISIFWIDISERRRAEEALRKSERKFSAIFRQASLPLMMTRWSDHTLVDVNDAWVRLFGYTFDEVYGKTPQELRIQRDAAFRQQANETVQQNEFVMSMELEAYTKSGEARILLANISRVEIESQEYTISSFQDITERKWMEDELRRSNADLEQFAYIASHDLQEPLRTVAGMVELLQKQYAGRLEPEADEYIHYAVDASERMRQLINDLLEFSRVNSRGQGFHATDMEKVLSNVLVNLQNAILENQAQVSHDPLPTIQADEHQMLQVMQNLISNAIKFRSQQPPQIHVSAEQNETGWCFAVRDNGIGIDPKYFERIFLLFQRLHTRRKYPGTGIGLALCKKIIERHSGKLWVSSEREHGSTFYFTIPEKKR